MPVKEREILVSAIARRVGQVEMDQHPREVAIVRQAQNRRNKELPGYDYNHGQGNNALQFEKEGGFPQNFSCFHLPGSIIIWIRCQDVVSDPREKETAQSGALEAEQLAPFRFLVTWSSLVEHGVDPGTPSSANNLPVEAGPARANGVAGAQWSMVVPRMAQPAAVAALPAAGAFEAARFSRPRYVAPRFEVSLQSVPLFVKTLLSGAVAMLLIPGWRDTGSPGARAVQLESTMSAANFVPASTREGGVAIDRTSLGRTDYRLQFNWSVNPSGIAWVFRFKDADNYYGVRVNPAGSQALSVEHYAVYKGAIRSRTAKLAPLVSRDASVGIRMDAAGSQFKIFVNGNQVGQWSDAHLTTGGLGFMEDGAVRNDVTSVRISFP